MSATLVPSVTPTRPAAARLPVTPSHSDAPALEVVSGSTHEPRLARLAARGPLVRSASGRLVTVPLHCAA